MLRCSPITRKLRLRQGPGRGDLILFPRVFSEFMAKHLVQAASCNEAAPTATDGRTWGSFSLGEENQSCQLRRSGLAPYCAKCGPSEVPGIILRECLEKETTSPTPGFLGQNLHFKQGLQGLKFTLKSQGLSPHWVTSLSRA